MRAEATHEGPGAAFPPTMFFVIALGVGLGLHDAHPLKLIPPSLEQWRTPFGIVLFVAGMTVFWWGLLTLLRARTGVMLQRPASSLIERGPYKWSRNPQYAAFVVGYIGLAALANTLWLVLLLPIVIGFLLAIVIRREERYLRAQFGPDYDDYCRRVGRWI